MITQANSSDTETPDGFRVVEVTREPIELYKILKFEGLVGSGGGAKGVVASGQVLVNGIIETQKRKKIVSGDTIEFGEDKIFIKLALSESDGVVPALIAPALLKAKPAAKKKPAARKAIPIGSKKNVRK